MKRHIGIIAAALVCVSGLAACSTGSNDETSKDEGATSSKVEEGAYPVTIEHVFGETTLEEEPKRVATLGWSDQDHVLALGVVPVGATALAIGGNENGSSDWFDERLAEIGGEAPKRYSDADGIPFEEIAETQPDVILAANSGITQQDYDKLVEIAPVVAYPKAMWVTSWQESLEMIGDALGRPALADEVEKESLKTIDDAKAKYSQLEGKSFVFTYFAPGDLSTIGVYAGEDPRVATLEAFGLVTPDWVAGVVPANSFYGDVDAEDAKRVKADVLLTYETNEGDLEKVLDNRLLNRIPPVASGNYAVEQLGTQRSLAVTNPTPLSLPVIVDEFLPKVADALGE